MTVEIHAPEDPRLARPMLGGPRWNVELKSEAYLPTTMRSLEIHRWRVALLKRPPMESGEPRKRRGEPCPRCRAPEQPMRIIVERGK